MIATWFRIDSLTSIVQFWTRLILEMLNLIEPTHSIKDIVEVGLHVIHEHLYFSLSHLVMSTYSPHILLHFFLQTVALANLDVKVVFFSVCSCNLSAFCYTLDDFQVSHGGLFTANMVVWSGWRGDVSISPWYLYSFR